jgi:hypothetical protein
MRLAKDRQRAVGSPPLLDRLAGGRQWRGDHKLTHTGEAQRMAHELNFDIALLVVGVCSAARARPDVRLVWKAPAERIVNFHAIVLRLTRVVKVHFVCGGQRGMARRRFRSL